MIKTILWDFDGVIIDSMKIKGDAFKELFVGNDLNSILKIEKYHYENGGKSRFEKIKYFYTDILKNNINNQDILKLANKFASIIEKKLYNKNNLINETISYIESNYKKYNFHIVSGAEHNELINLCKFFDLKRYFISINGSPIRKTILVKNIITKYCYNKGEIVLIGDSITDYNATIDNDIKFYGYNNLELEKYGNYIKSFKGLKI